KRPRPRRAEDAPPVIRVPDGKGDHLRWPIVAPIGVVALVLGFVFPRACGLKFGRDAIEEGGAAASAEASSSVEDTPPVVTSASTAAPVLTAAPPDPNAVALVTVAKSTLMSCQDPPASALKPSHCGDPLLDGVVMPKLEELGSCPAATAVVGRLSITVDVDLVKKLVKVTAGKSSVKKNGTPQDKAIEPLVSCLRNTLRDLPDAAEGTGKREHQRYVMAYSLVIAAPAGAATAGSPTPSGSVAPEKSASGTAEVEVDAALVRDAPSTNGALLARLTRGTKVTIYGLSGHWYHVKFGEDQGKTGWIFRTNIGK
ncbi:MAG: SH3 domain-containing protein, partial [Polyangiales bacterium]